MAHRSAHRRSARVEPQAAPASGSEVPRPPVLQRARGWVFGRRYELAALILYAFVLVARAPWVLMLGRFWAEEATGYLAYAWNHSFLEALTAPQYGYFNLGGN